MCAYVVEASYPPIAYDKGIVTFSLNTGVTLRYKINIISDQAFLSCISGQPNHEIFMALSIKDKHAFIEEIVGYTPGQGIFPYVKVDDIIKVIKGLANYRQEDLTQSSQKFTLSVKKHKQTKLNFKL